jgi:exportin-T
MATLWGGPDLSQSASPPQPAFPGFDRFLVERFNPICWNVLGDPKLVPGDAQQRGVLQELAVLQYTILAKTGVIFLNHLRTEFFPSLGAGMNGDAANEYLNALTTKDRRGFVNFFL